jgi:hypothetical protein
MQHQSLALSFLRQNISLALILLLIAGCAQVNPGLDESPTLITPPNVQSDFDELLAFGANMAKSSPAARIEICRSLLKRQKASPESGIQLQLMVGRLLSDSCGEIPKILDSINTIAPELLSGDRMRNLVSIHTEALKRLLPVPKKTSTPTPERKQKTDKSGPEPKEPTESKKSETDLLREKLEAIRSMEKHLDESAGAR